MRFVKSILPDFFNSKKVLDVGSGDINGNNLALFEKCEYEGNDVMDAPNVTIVSKTKDLSFGRDNFDTIVSTECFEHDPEYKESFKKIYQMLKPLGLFCFTCASTGRQEHGTRLTSPKDSYGTIGNLPDMVDYYKNLTEVDLNEALELDTHFIVWDTYYNSESSDLYFVGIKRHNGADSNVNSLPAYIDPHVVHTKNNSEARINSWTKACNNKRQEEIKHHENSAAAHLQAAARLGSVHASALFALIMIEAQHQDKITH